ncbi:amino acid ABC transporter permease [Pseudonocardia sp. HH130630-07]|uniref:amino acid ABC transporter permease n=1 Tax=Pseudonocardia sp. HH130630-07 TaxID=1690815 RepID=UPI000814D37D|nr:amino acid ABC transporter permease [Pseudonocardia sp. HH130630-07]ANY08417.1 amino acid ABC transporter permease [Pseudonocardia sp. HH130630-07]
MSALVLFDTPGPQARRRNTIYTVVFALALAVIAWAVVTGLGDKGQWAPELWTPFLSWSTWSQFLLPGLLNTIIAAVLAVVIALPFGLLLGVGRLSTSRWVSRVSGFVVEFFRAIPVLLLMVFAAEFYFSYTDVPTSYRPLLSVVTGLVLYNGSVIAEIVRAGVLSLPAGQREAAEALGLRPGQAMRLILLPQAVTLMLPALVSQLVVVLKDTALGGQLTVGYTELVRTSGTITGNFANTIPTLIVVAALFIVLNGILTAAANALQRRLSRSTKLPEGTDTAHPPTADISGRID